MSEKCKIKKNDIIIYQHLYGLYTMEEFVAIILNTRFDFWLGRNELTIFANSKILKVKEDMITYRKIN